VLGAWVASLISVKFCLNKVTNSGGRIEFVTEKPDQSESNQLGGVIGAALHLALSEPNRQLVRQTVDIGPFEPSGCLSVP
jgi:hypothetical protein